MFSGLLPQGLTEADLSPEAEDEDDVADVKEFKSKSSLERLSEVEGNSGLVVEVDLSSTPNIQENESPTCSLPGIPQEMWQVCRLTEYSLGREGYVHLLLSL